MKGASPARIYVDKKMPGYKPMHITVPRRWPVHYIKEYKDKILDLLKKKVITRLKPHETPEWIPPSPFITKDGKQRFITEYSHLKKL